MKPEHPTRAWALLRRAREHVRSRSRSAEYHTASDRFCALFLGEPFQVEPDVYKVVGTDCSALDWLYEDLSQGGERSLAALDAATRHLQEMADLTAATAALEPLQDALQSAHCAVLDVCRALVGGITVVGHEALLARGAHALVQDWLRLWQDALWEHNSQQARLGRLAVVMRAAPGDKPRLMATFDAYPDDLLVPATGFAQGVQAYLDRYAETGASAFSLVGGVPFSRSLSRRGLEEWLQVLERESGFLGSLSRLLRLAQDVRFDPSEPINAGVMGYAAEHGLRLIDLDASQLPRSEIDAGLRRAWDAWQAGSWRSFEARVDSIQDESLKASLQTFVANLRLLASRLAQAGHQATAR